MIEPVLERRPHHRVHDRRHLRVVQPVLRLALKLRLLDEQAQHAGQAFADVLGRQRDALRRQVMGVDVVADGLAQPGAEAVFVRAARAGGNAVDEAAQVLVGGLGPLQRQLEPGVGVALDDEGGLVHGLRPALGDDLLQELRQPLVVLEDFFGLLALVLEDDLHALVDVADDLQPLADERGIELDLREDRRVRVEIDGGAAAARRAHLLQRALDLAALERHLPFGAVALHAGAQLGGERVDDAGADAVQAAGRLVVAVLELAARVEHREDHLEGALLRLGVLVHGDAAAVVADRDRAAVGVQRDGDVRGMAVHGLVHRVVEDLPDEVVKAGAADAADVHARALADGLEPLENGDVFGCVVRTRSLR